MNENEFAESVQRQRRALYAAAYAYLGSEADALEAVDEAVYRGLMSFKKLRQPEYFATWLMRILINVCKDELKRRKRTVTLEELPESAIESFDALPLKDAVARLPRELREVVALHFFAELTLSETAQTLKIPQGTAATRLRRATALLRLELSEDAEPMGKGKHYEQK